MVSVPVPTCVPFEKAADVAVATLARLFTCSEYDPATASDVVVAEAMFLSATVAVNAASWLGSSKAGSESFRVSSAAVNVP